MGLKTGKDVSEEGDKPYVPPMGCDTSRSLNPSTSKPLMLTNGSNAPGAASAHARALSDPQKAGGIRVKIFFFNSYLRKKRSKLPNHKFFIFFRLLVLLYLVGN